MKAKKVLIVETDTNFGDNAKTAIRQKGLDGIIAEDFCYAEHLLENHSVDIVLTDMSFVQYGLRNGCYGETSDRLLEKLAPPVFAFINSDAAVDAYFDQVRYRNMSDIKKDAPSEEEIITALERAKSEVPRASEYYDKEIRLLRDKDRILLRQDLAKRLLNKFGAMFDSIKSEVEFVEQLKQPSARSYPLPLGYFVIEQCQEQAVPYVVVSDLAVNGLKVFPYLVATNVATPTELMGPNYSRLSKGTVHNYKPYIRGYIHVVNNKVLATNDKTVNAWSQAIDLALDQNK